ncbi:homoserine kinase [Egibacter rhizosphaerae]|uniref:Homoserine kinase n=1 Tax=Egibacter rhizosphaerae TaxID=1670831 RepID=A0A411YD82_9ACTN|nr:homoserine kinase [Egibacter rhizosphaerae]QBI19136.1 homoserine kinase [Egibacter rhizosphaerae]
MEPDDVVRVEVPGTSANLGPGFDVLAAALDLHLVAATAAPGPRRVTVEGQGADELPGDDGNLVWRAFVGYCERFGAEVPDVGLRVRSDIPLERGLGSSAAAAVAGVALGRAVTRAGGSDQDLIDLAAAIEGHADNAAAAVLGGIVVAVDGVARRFDPAPGLRPLVCIPSERQATQAARAILPARVPLATAAANGGRTALALAGLTGLAALDPRTFTDELHEPARLEAMGPTGALVRRLRDTGIAACLSGAGPTVLAIVGARDESAPASVAELAGPEWEVRVSGWDRSGAAACPPTVLPAEA